MTTRNIASGIIAALATLAILAFASSPAIAESAGGGPAFAPAGNGPANGKMGKMGGNHGGGQQILKALEALSDELEVSEDQRAEIKSIVQDGRDAIQPLKDKAAALHAEMKVLLSAKKLDKKKIKAKHAEIQAVKAEIADKRMDMILDSLSVLEDGQRAELFEIIGECKGKKGSDECKAMFKKGNKGKGEKGKKGKKGKSF